jgi:hypothetical protein
MRLAIKNQLTSKQGTQKDVPGSVSVVAVNTYNTRTGSTSSQIWRKSLFPTSSSKHVGIRVSDVLRPNGYIYQGHDASGCLDGKQGAIVMQTNKRNTQAESAVTCSYDASSNVMRRVGANPENTVTKTASTVLSDAYYSSAKAYQHARGIDPEQHRSFTSDGDSKTTKEYNMTTAVASSHANACSKTVFKPSNPSFQRNGPVSSSTRTVRVQHQNLRRENVMFKKTYRAQLNSNYISGVRALRTIKSITENQCNTANRGLTRVRNAYRPKSGQGIRCCVCKVVA